MRFNEKTPATLRECSGKCGQTKVHHKPFWCRKCGAEFKKFLGGPVRTEQFVGVTEERTPPAQIRNFRRLQAGFREMLLNDGTNMPYRLR